MKIDKKIHLSESHNVKTSTWIGVNIITSLLSLGSIGGAIIFFMNVGVFINTVKSHEEIVPKAATKEELKQQEIELRTEINQLRQEHAKELRSLKGSVDDIKSNVKGNSVRIETLIEQDQVHHDDIMRILTR